jgi:NAD(P)-dependent dehydrogenase (short-subunit alcohol dehydrogenase family)
MAPGPVIIVGVGPGLGLSLGRTFAAEGHDVAMLARSADRLDEYAAQLASTGVKVRGYVSDAAQPADLRSALTRAVADLGAPDVLVYNAAVMRRDTPTDGDDDGWANALAVNLLGAKVAAETVLPTLRGGQGSILFTSGAFAVRPSPQSASLSVGKAALRAYAIALHAQQQGTGVHVASITIGGRIDGGEPRFTADTVARAYLDLHQQAKTGWTDELVLD